MYAAVPAPRCSSVIEKAKAELESSVRSSGLQVRGNARASPKSSTLTCPFGIHMTFRA